MAAVLFAPYALLPLEVSAFLFGLIKLAGLFSIVTMVLRLMGKSPEHRGKILALSFLGIGGYFVEEFRNATSVDPHNYSLRGAILKYLTPLDVEDPKYGKINFVSLSEASATTLWLGLVAVVGVVLLATTRGPLRALLERARGAGADEIDGPRGAAGASTITPANERSVSGAAAVGVSFLIGTLLPPLLPGRAIALAYEVRSPYLFATIFVFAVLTWLLWTGSGAEMPRVPGER